MEATALVETFLAACGDGAVATEGLGARLLDVTRGAAGRLPFAVDARALAAALAGKPALREAVTSGAEVPAAAVDELAFAGAAARGDPRAFAWFDARYVAPLPAALAHMRLGADVLDEVQQRVREKLLLPGEGGAAPRVAGYAGDGRLEGLVRVAATRAALDRVRAARREVPADDGLLDAAIAGGDPSLDALKARARGAFRESFEAAVRSLGARERTLLRLHLLGGVTLERLAAMHGVHRATVVRWIAAAREDVLKATRAGMRARMALTDAELDALMGAAQSRLDLSVERLLRSQEG